MKSQSAPKSLIRLNKSRIKKKCFKILWKSVVWILLKSIALFFKLKNVLKFEVTNLKKKIYWQNAKGCAVNVILEVLIISIIVHIFGFQDLLQAHYVANSTHGQEDLLSRLSDYCGKPMDDKEDSEPLKWDFYNSFYFAYTVVSTIGTKSSESLFI